MRKKRFDEELRESIDTYCPDGAVLLSDHDNAIVGVGEYFGDRMRVIYDVNKIILNLKSDGMSEEEAQEWFDFNIAGAHLGDADPIFMTSRANLF